MMEQMKKKISLGPWIEATQTVRENVPSRILAEHLHSHRTVDKSALPVVDIFEEMPTSAVLESAASSLQALEHRSAKVIHEMELDSEQSSGAYGDMLDLQLCRYLGPFVQSKFHCGLQEYVIITGLSASYLSREFDEMDLPYYSTIVGTPIELSEIVVFTTLCERMDLHEALIETDWFGLTDITQQVFADLLEYEFCSEDLEC
jgi:hypothetical protein